MFFNKTKSANPYRHGDLGFKPIDKVPAGKKTFSGKSFVLAEGETTGHKHVITAEPQAIVEIYTNEQGQQYLKVLDGNAVITHEEHKPVTVAPGSYQITKEREHDYFKEAERQVID